MAIESDINRFMRAADNVSDERGFIYPDYRYVNAYQINREYGGAEEGGWWYDTYRPLGSMYVKTKGEALRVFDFFNDILADDYDAECSRFSVLDGDDFDIWFEDEPAQFKPENRPHYE